MKKKAATEPSSHSTVTHSKDENANEEDTLAIMTRDVLTQMTPTINKLKFYLDCVMSIKIVP